MHDSSYAPFIAVESIYSSPADVLGHPSPSPIQLLCWIVAFPESDDSNEQSRAVLEGIPKLQGVQNEKWEAFPSFASKSSKLSKFCLFLLRKKIAKKNLPDWSQKKAFFLRFPKQGTLLAGSLALVAAYCFSTDLGSWADWAVLAGHLDLFWIMSHKLSLLSKSYMV